MLNWWSRRSTAEAWSITKNVDLFVMLDDIR